ncbi:hypothetical protein [Bifidobacterium simiarum]|uniref:Uncharacterized protein n=1 Tax=Bifidobacterium simiarum TaxID=2045441 RepID=A0A2M9HD96_9BIFI|nr:hypothetical protein [Bifidobacterium simiarum]PJM74776.1 hypothetical protein CSQ87_08595 [Bifidobacterium simiarum]
MPGWIWIVLVVFLFVVLIVGGVYVILHAIAAMHVIGGTGDRVAQRLSRIESEGATERSAEPPAFTRPLSETAERYAATQARIIEHREQVHQRHVAAWKRWKTFNDLDR